MSADYVVADAESTFCHGNLVRGICPIGMFSKTLSTTTGLSRSLRMYLSNDTLDAATAARFRLVHETAPGVQVTQSRAFDVATMLAAQAELVRVLLAARLPYDAELVAAEAVGMGRCLISNGGFTSAALPDSHASQALQLSFTVLRTSQLESTLSSTVHVVEVPTSLASDAMSGIWLQWPSNALLIFRGSSPDSFCLGGESSAAHRRDGSFIEGVELLSQLHERIERADMPTIVVCHGATRGEGLLFPCLGSIVLAHSDATFGLPEIRHGALLGVVSVVARRRLGQTACERLFCTGDVIDATTANQLGLVDVVGSMAQVEAYVASLTKRFMAPESAQILAIERGPMVHQLRYDVPIRIEVDEHSQVLPPPPIIQHPSSSSLTKP